MKQNLLLFCLVIFCGASHAQFTIDTVKAPCTGGCSGYAHITPEIAGYSYTWSNTQSGLSNGALCEGPVYCVVRDAGNVIIDTAHAVIPAAVLFWDYPTFTSTNTSCSPPYNGDITVHVHGGLPGFTYNWSDGYTSQDSARPVSTGYFNVTVHDAAGCSTLSFITVTPNPMQVYTSNMLPATTCTTYDGRVSLGVQFASPISYLWSDGGTAWENWNLQAGVFSVTVTDVLNCTVVHTDSVPYLPVLTGELLVKPACNGAPIGFLSAYQLQSNHHPLTFAWSTGDTSVAIQSPPPGEYILTVTDGMGCQQVITDTVFSGNLLVDTAFVNATTCISGDGIAMASVTATSPYYCSWYNVSSGSNYGIGDTVYNLQTGNYSLYVEDAIGCNTYISFTLNGDLQVTHSETPITCENPIGTTTFNFQSSGSGYIINWGDGSAVEYTLITATSATHNYTNPSTYYVYMIDAVGFCPDTIPVIIANQGILIDTNTIEYPGCLHPGGGQISVSASGAQPPYSYSWSNGNTTNTITQLPAGTYTLTITDNTSCQNERVFSLPEVNSFSYYALALANATSCNGSNGIASIQPYGGNPPYMYMWNTNPVQTNDTATGLSAGTYYITVTDLLGCTTAGHVDVSDGCMPQITGVVYIDSNSNCLLDSSDLPLAQSLVTAIHNGQFYYGTTDSSGYYSITVPDTGLYQLNANNVTDDLCLSLACNNFPRIVNINTVGITLTGNDFVYSFDTINPTANVFVHPGWSSSIPGSPKDFWIFAFNSGNVTNTLYTYTFTFDSALTFVSSDMPYTSYNASTRTIQWINTPHTYIGKIHFIVAASTPLNYELQNYFSVTHLANECKTSDNFLYTSELVTGSRDPNSKEVQPAGPLTDADSVLVYTIHFQNNGNDTTWFITLLDTLQPELDPASVVNLASSHPYTEFTITGTGILRWFFNPIYLPDSLTNPLGSQGFVMFSIKRKSGLAPGHAINNTAHIYFDYNEAVVTNTISSTIATPVGIKTVASQSNVSAQAYPNPFTSETFIAIKGAEKGSSLAVSDITGKRIMEIAIPDNGLINVKRDKLASGLYFYTVLTNGRQMATGRLIAE